MDSKMKWRFPVDERRKAACMREIRLQVEEKRFRRYPSFAENVWNELRFQSPWHWALQGGVLFAALLVAVWGSRMAGTNSVNIAASSVFIVFAGNICLSGVARLFSWHMAELEQTLYLNLKQMICIRMLEAGVVDSGVLAILTGVGGGCSVSGTGVYFLYMLVPFLWSDVLYLYMLTAFRNLFSGFGQTAAGVICGLLALFPAFLEKAYQPDYVPVWAALSVAGILVLGVELYRIPGKIERGEHVCLN